jgi:FkbM family methyltransferase
MKIGNTARQAVQLLAYNLALFREMVGAKLNTAARPMPALPASRRIGDVEFECDLEGYRGTAPMYFGSYALPLIHAMKKFLRPSDVFFDVGANIGYITAHAAALVGPRGQVHSFEPVPTYYARLRRLAELNPEYTIVANACAAGESNATAKIYVTHEAGQNTMVAGYKQDDEVREEQKIPVIRLDTYIQERAVGRIAMIKIDAEGSELPILLGLQHYLETTAHRPAIVCEIAPRAYPLIGKTLGDLSDWMKQFGYAAHSLMHHTASIDVTKVKQVQDVLLLAS